MTKLEYLKQLEDALKNRMSRKDIDDIIRDYAEYFAEGQRQGKSEFETARGLGTPQEVAEQIVSEGMEMCIRDSPILLADGQSYYSENPSAFGLSL